MKFVPVVARVSFGTTLATAALIFAAAFGRRLHLLTYAAGHTLFSVGAVAGLAAIALGFAWWIGRLVTGDSSATRWGAIGLIGALAVMAMPLRTLWLGLTEPPLVDITTDAEEPPAFAALLKQRTDAANPPSYDGQQRLFYDGEEMTRIEAQKRAYPDVKPVKLITPLMVVYWHAFEVSKQMGWDIVAFDPKACTVEATDEDFWTGDVSDIALRVRQVPSPGMGSRLDIRAKSRNGATDAGRNAANVKAYIKELLGK
ncbi:MAG TPA: DUF1499 domain-containing protein [Rhizomicrobium sp.]|jgi:hypothetical protein